MFTEHRDGKGATYRTVNLLPAEIDRMEIWQAALYFRPSVDENDAAVRSAKARERGGKVEPVAVSLSPERRAALAGA